MSLSKRYGATYIEEGFLNLLNFLVLISDCVFLSTGCLTFSSAFYAILGIPYSKFLIRISIFFK